MKSEKEISSAVEIYLNSKGWRTAKEIQYCDIAGVKSGETCAVECKQKLNMKLFFQGVERQRKAEYVSLAFSEEKGIAAGQRRAQAKNLCGRLGLGVITVKEDGSVRIVKRPRKSPLIGPRLNKKELIGAINGRKKS